MSFALSRSIVRAASFVSPAIRNNCDASEQEAHKLAVKALAICDAEIETYTKLNKHQFAARIAKAKAQRKELVKFINEINLDAKTRFVLRFLGK